MNNKHIHLVAFYSLRPKPGVNTSVKGWMNDTNNLLYDEKVEITRGVRNSVKTANVILDLVTKTVVRNSFNDNRDFKELFKYFFAGYHKYITEIMTQLDPAYLTAILDELEAEMKAEQENAEKVSAE